MSNNKVIATEQIQKLSEAIAQTIADSLGASATNPDEFIFRQDSSGELRKISWASIVSTWLTYLLGEEIFALDPHDHTGYASEIQYNAISVTTSNVSAASGNFYDCTIAGLTANRDFNLPTPAAAGEIVELRIRDGDDTYALLIKANAIEITRLFIAGEFLRLRSYGTGAGDWQIETDGRIPCSAGMYRSTTGESYGNGAFSKVNVNSELFDVGHIADPTTNRRFNVRRNGKMIISGASGTNGHSSGTFVIACLFINGVEVARSPATYSMGTSVHIGTFPPYIHEVAVGDYIELYVYQETGGTRDVAGTTNNRSKITVSEIL